MSEYEIELEKDLSDQVTDRSEINNITQISRSIFISSNDGARNPKQLILNNIRCILDVSEHKVTDFTKDMYTKMKIRYMHISIPDSRTDQFKEKAPMCVNYINEFRKHGNVLISCLGGLSTSVAVIIYYLLNKTYGMPGFSKSKKILRILIERVINNRKYIDMNDKFIEDLEDYEAELTGIPVNPDHSFSMHRNVKRQKEESRKLRMEMELDRKEAVEKWTIESRHRI